MIWINFNLDKKIMWVIYWFKTISTQSLMTAATQQVMNSFDMGSYISATVQPLNR